MAKPDWRKSNLYQGILSKYRANGIELTPAQRRRLRKNLVIVRQSLPSKYTAFWCHNLFDAFQFNRAPQGSSYWVAVYYARTIP